MEYQKGKSQVDLTLRLGLSYDEKRNLEETKTIGGSELFDSSSTLAQTSSDKGVCLNYKGLFGMQIGQEYDHGEFDGSSSTYGRREIGNIVGPSTPLLSTLYEGGLANISFYDQGFLPNTSSAKQHDIDDGKMCKSCGVKSTPLWRKGPDGPQTLCNACGLRHSRNARKCN